MLLNNYLSTTRSISVSCLHLDYIFTNFQNGDIKGSTSQIINCNYSVLLFINSISQSSSCRFIDDTGYFKSCNPSCIFCCLSLWIIKIGRYSDNCLLNPLPKICLSSFLHFHENICSNLGWRIFFSSCFNPSFISGSTNNFIWHIFSILLDFRIIESLSNQSLCCKNSIFGICNWLTFSRCSN